MTPAERSTRARAAAYAAHAKHGRSMTLAARTAFLEKFERQVDPDGTLPEAERLRRAELARRAYMTGLAMKAVRARARSRKA